MEQTQQRRSLLDITADMRALDDLLEDVGGDISDPQVEAAVSQWFAELDQDLNTKVDGYCGLIRQKELLASARRAEADQLLLRARTEENQVKSLKERLKFAMTERGLKKAGNVRTASVCGNGGKQPVEIDPIEARTLPPRFQKVLIDIDADKVREALEAGEELAFARILPRGTHLRVK